MSNIVRSNIFEKYRGMSPYLKIGEDEWKDIMTSYEKDVILEDISEILLEYGAPIPNITEKEIQINFTKLKQVRWEDVLVEGDWFPRNDTKSRYSLSYQEIPMYFKRVNIGNNASNPFHIENRWKVDHIRSISGWKAWQTKEGIKTVVRAFFTLDKVLLGVNEETLRMATTLRKYIASQFKPVIAKSLYDMFQSKNVLDFSAGWGDRLCGFFTSNHGQHYVGIDPNISNHVGYKNQIEFYSKHRTFFETIKTAEMIPQAAEDVDYSKYVNFFDTIFTSPPYFNTEKYSQDDTQSWVRYGDIDRWNKEFLHKTIDKIIPTLKENGILAINIADVFNAKIDGYVDITNAMNDFIQSKGLVYQGCIGMAMSKRLNSGGAGKAKSDYFDDTLLQKARDNEKITFGEPIWIWKKTT